MNAHEAWLICNADLNFSVCASEIIPLILADSADIIKVWSEFDATHEEVVTHIVCQAVIGNFWFLCTEVTLN